MMRMKMIWKSEKITTKKKRKKMRKVILWVPE
jgi:hypothetical protein